MTVDKIKEINSIFYTSFRQLVKKPHSLAMCYLIFFMRLVENIIRLRFHYKKVGRILFFVPSLNNKKSVKTILDNLKIDGITIYGIPKMDLPYARCYLTSLRGLHLFQKLYSKSTKDDKLLMRQFFEDFMNTYGLYYTIDKILRENPQLKLIVLANDHITSCRCLIELAEKYDIKTLYVQHASITERFPPLHFSYSFLDGMETYDKYKTIGDMRGKVFLTGSPRFDELYDYKSTEKNYDIGVALNMLDSCNIAVNLCNYLRDKVSRNIIVRPHPRMGELFDIDAFRSIDIKISDPTKESSFAFLSKVKFLIANESSIHLDSALIGVPSILYNFSSQEVMDWYSYVKNGMVNVCTSKDEVEKELNNHHICPVDRIQYYNASFGTSIEGSVGAFIANFIEDYLNKSEEEALCNINTMMCDNGEYYVIRK